MAVTRSSGPDGAMAETEARLESLISRLRERGYRATPQRAAVLRALTAGDDHPTAEQIYDNVRAEFPMTSLATIYKTLAVLKEVDAICELAIGGGGTRYDGCRDDPHPHLICVRCNRVVDLDNLHLGETIEEVENLTGYKILSHRHDYFGVCTECRESCEGQSNLEGTMPESVAASG
jgi:Fur family peroxide stress response transcriptional regulator